MTLVMQITPDEFADLERGQTLTVLEPLKDIHVQVCAAGKGYQGVECAAFQVATDLRKGKALFINLKMHEQIPSALPEVPQ